MNSRFEIREATSYFAPEGWVEVTIIDRIAGLQARASAKSYGEAVIQAWQKLGAIKTGNHPLAEAGAGE